MSTLLQVQTDKNDSFEQAIQKLTGDSVETLRKRTVWAQRIEVERKTGKSLRILSRFPFLGRGSVLRDRLLSGEQVNVQIDEALSKL